MHNYYGMAIRNNVDDIHNRRKALGAVLYHYLDFKNQDYRHSTYPNDENSWCMYRLDKITEHRNIKIQQRFQLKYFILMVFISEFI